MYRTNRIFMGHGTELEAKGFKISSKEESNVVFEQKDGKLFLHNEIPVIISSKSKNVKFVAGQFRKIDLN